MQDYLEGKFKAPGAFGKIGNLILQVEFGKIVCIERVE